MREKVVAKIVTKWMFKYHFFIHNPNNNDSKHHSNTQEIHISVMNPHWSYRYRTNQMGVKEKKQHDEQLLLHT